VASFILHTTLLLCSLTGLCSSGHMSLTRSQWMSSSCLLLFPFFLFRWSRSSLEEDESEGEELDSVDSDRDTVLLPRFFRFFPPEHELVIYLYVVVGSPTFPVSLLGFYSSGTGAGIGLL